LNVPKGSFSVILGRVGSGKTSLLQALVGEMRKKEGHVSFSGTTSLVTQTPWIQNASVKDNILFGKEYDASRMAQVVHACALEEDVAALPDGLETEIGGEYSIRHRFMSGRG
jgi:ATP-binding cassette subfamily C (CFTR/MRP) protein 1